MFFPELHGVIFQRYSCLALLVVEVTSERCSRDEDGLLVSVESIVLDNQVEIVNKGAFFDDPEQTGGVDGVIALLDIQSEVLEGWTAHTTPLLHENIIFL